MAVTKPSKQVILTENEHLRIQVKYLQSALDAAQEDYETQKARADNLAETVHRLQAQIESISRYIPKQCPDCHEDSLVLTSCDKEAGCLCWNCGYERDEYGRD